MEIIKLENGMLAIVEKDVANIMSIKDWRWTYGQLHPEHWTRKGRKK